MPDYKEHEQDIMLVRNIDVDCEDTSVDIVKTTRRIRDSETGAEITEYLELTDECDHSKYFQVKWGGQRFRIAPGQTRRMPRFIAEHFTKHLADHILGKREIEEKRVGLINHPIERPKIIEEILLGVDEPFNALGEIDDALEAFNQVEELNSKVAAEVGYNTHGVKSHELPGEVNAGLVSRDHFKPGEEIKSTEEILGQVQEDPKDTPEVTKTRAELIREIRQLDPIYKLKGTENKGQLLSILGRFS